jgi:hypothetical protein
VLPPNHALAAEKNFLARGDFGLAVSAPGIELSLREDLPAGYWNLSLELSRSRSRRGYRSHETERQLHVKTLKRDAPSAFSPQRHLHLRLGPCGVPSPPRVPSERRVHLEDPKSGVKQRDDAID